LRNKEFWEQDLSLIESLTKTIAYALEEIDINGVEQGFFKILARINFKINLCKIKY